MKYSTVKALNFCVGFISRILHVNFFREIKFHANILTVHCNNVTNAKSAKLNFNEITFMGKSKIEYLQNIRLLQYLLCALTFRCNITSHELLPQTREKDVW